MKNHLSMPRAAAASCLLLLLNAGTALAQGGTGINPEPLGNGEFLIKNDRFPISGPLPGNVNTLASVQAGFIAGEEAAAVLTLPFSTQVAYPMRVKRIQIGWSSTSGDQPDVVQGSIKVYRGSVLAGSAGLIFDSSIDGGTDGYLPQLRDSASNGAGAVELAINEFDFVSDNIIINSGTTVITVSLEFSTPPNTTIGPSVVSDRGPNSPSYCTNGKNAIYGTFNGGASHWINACDLLGLGVTGLSGNSISGNFVIRAVVDHYEPPPPAAACLADVCGIGGPPAVPDGLVTGDDFTAYINAFASGDTAIADVCGIGGPPEVRDGLITGDDFTAFINSFAGGCP